MTNAIRNVSMKLSLMASPDPAESRHLQLLLTEFPRALMCHLRKVPYSHAEVLGDATPEHVPLYIANQLYCWVSRRVATDNTDDAPLRIIDVELVKLMEVCGTSERIAKTPVVRSYRIFSRQCVILFLLTLPWGIVDGFKWLTIPFTIVMAYFLIGMEVVAEHVEEPFGYEQDDLDLEGICSTIEASVGQIFSKTSET